jgi:hypothetical protein
MMENTMRCATLLLIAALATAILGSCGRTAPLSNRPLIAAMPDGAESVIVLRLDELQREAPVLKGIAERPIVGLEGDEPADAMDAVLRRGIQAAGPIVWAHGGSRFTPPPDLGLGDYDGRSIWVTERPLDDVIRALATGEGIGGPIERHEAGDVTVYEGRRTIEFYGGESKIEPMFVAFADSRTPMVAETREDIVQMLERWRGGHREVPARWRSPAQRLEIESPVVVLRRYDPESEGDQFSPVNRLIPPEERIEIEAVGVVLADPAKSRYRLEVITRQPQRAEEFYRHWLSEREFAWTVEATEEGFAATLEGAAEQEEDVAAALYSLLIVFGWNFYI